MDLRQVNSLCLGGLRASQLLAQPAISPYLKGKTELSSNAEDLLRTGREAFLLNQSECLDKSSGHSVPLWFDAAGFFPVDNKIAVHTSAAVTSARVSILSLYIPQQGSSAYLFVCLLLFETRSHLLSWISFCRPGWPGP